MAGRGGNRQADDASGSTAAPEGGAGAWPHARSRWHAGTREPGDRIFLIGPTGAGKTTIGRRIAGHFGLHFRDLDQEIEARTGVEVARIFDIEGEAGFRRREAALLDELTQLSGIVLATGAGAVLDLASRRHLRDRGLVVYLQASVDRQLRRLARDQRRPLLQNADRRAILEAMARVRNPVYEALADLTIVCEPVSVGRMASKVIEQLERAAFGAST